MEAKIKELAEIWIGYKIRLIEVVGISNDSMHIHGALLILFVSAIIMRRRPDSIWCWLVVFVAEIFNEYADLKGLAPGEDSLDASLHDLYNTMVWPTVIVVLGRVLFPPRKKASPEPEAISGDFADQATDETIKQPPPV